jgi:hypothetical protein
MRKDGVAQDCTQRRPARTRRTIHPPRQRDRRSGCCSRRTGLPSRTGMDTSARRDLQKKKKKADSAPCRGLDEGGEGVTAHAAALASSSGLTGRCSIRSTHAITHCHYYGSGRVGSPEYSRRPRPIAVPFRRCCRIFDNARAIEGRAGLSVDT